MEQSAPPVPRQLVDKRSVSLLLRRLGLDVSNVVADDSGHVVITATFASGVAGASVRDREVVIDTRTDRMAFESGSIPGLAPGARVELPIDDFPSA